MTEKNICAMEFISTKGMIKETAPKPQHDAKLAVMRSGCPKCEDKGWYFVNEWIGTLQGRKDCSCKGKLPS